MGHLDSPERSRQSLGQGATKFELQGEKLGVDMPKTRQAITAEMRRWVRMKK